MTGFSALLVLSIWAQTAPAPPAFDVASVKFTSHGRNAEGLSVSDVKMAGPGRLMGMNASLEECIRWAWGLQEYEVSAPAWTKSDEASYDIEAKAPAETSEQQLRLMMRTLLMERFQLRVHTEPKTLPVYLLTVGPRGAKLEKATGDRPALLTSEGSQAGARITSERANMAGLARRLSRDSGRPVFDKTGIQGFYKIRMEWAREGDGASLFSAIQEQLGLKLEASKAPVDVLVVDHAERVPAVN